MTVKKSDKTGRRSKVIQSPGMGKFKIHTFTAAVSTTDESAGALFTHEITNAFMLY